MEVGCFFDTKDFISVWINCYAYWSFYLGGGGGISISVFWLLVRLFLFLLHDNYLSLLTCFYLLSWFYSWFYNKTVNFSVNWVWYRFPYILIFCFSFSLFLCDSVNSYLFLNNSSFFDSVLEINNWIGNNFLESGFSWVLSFLLLLVLLLLLFPLLLLSRTL